MQILKLRLIKDGKIVGYERHRFYQRLEQGGGGSSIYIEHSKNNKQTGWYDILLYSHEYIHHDDKEQFTALHDKNGKEDYHKDICKFRCDNNEEHIGVIEWISGGWWLQSIKDDDEGNYRVPLYDAEKDGHTNLGNIHENKELFEDK